MAIVTAYFDESETGGLSNGYFVVAGLVGEARHWARIEREWKHVLLEFDVEYLHMNEFAHKEPFKSWGRSKRDRFLAQCSHVLSSQRKYLHSASCSISARAYEAVCEKQGQEACQPYLDCLQQCSANVLKMFEKEAVAHQISLIFDRRPKCIGKAVDKLEELRTHPNIPAAVGAMLATVTPGDDRTMIPLQAADFIAYEVNKHYREPMRLRKSLKAINGIVGLHTELTISHLRSTFPEPCP
jgi:hypothetical protein